MIEVVSNISLGLLGLAPSLHAPHLFFWGGEDKGIPPEQRRAVADALTEAGKRFVNVEFSDCNHAFFNEDSPDRYNAAAARQSWAIGTAFLQDCLAVTLQTASGPGVGDQVRGENHGR